MNIEQLAPWPVGQPPAPELRDDESRMAVMESYALDALEGDAELQQITRFAARLCNAPIAQISLVEEVRQRFLAGCGLEASETPRSQSFCSHAMDLAEVMVVEDATRDPRFADNPLVTGSTGIRFYAGAPLISHEGAPLGALCIIDTEPRPGGLDELQREGLLVLAASAMRRLRHRRETLIATAALEKRESQIRAVADSIPDIAWSAGPGAVFEYYNARWQEMTGAEPPATIEEWRPFIHPDDYESTVEKFTYALEHCTPFEDEWRLKMADGGWRWILSRAMPSGEDPASAHWFGTITDIDNAHRKLLGRELVSRELSHRIKNIFAVVNGLIAIRARDYPDAGEFARGLSDTLMALSRANDYVTQEQHDGSGSLMGLLSELLAPYCRTSNECVSISGEDLDLSRRSATPLALVFHELATNSAKYGAFSVPEGRVDIEVSIDGDMLAICWREIDGPPVAEVEGMGFGSRLVELTVSSQLQGKLERDLKPTGLVARLTIPRDRL